MKRAVEYRDEVESDVREAYQWYEARSNGLGERFLQSTRRAVERVQKSPELYGRVYQNVRASPVKRFPYLVFYRIESTRILVMAIRHGKRIRPYLRERS